jgi:hypothetical protein
MSFTTFSGGEGSEPQRKKTKDRKNRKLLAGEGGGCCVEGFEGELMREADVFLPPLSSSSELIATGRDAAVAAQPRRLDLLSLPNYLLFSSVADPDPDPPDPHVFGPPGSGSGSFYHQRYGSGSRSCSGSGSGFFYHHAKIVRKTLIPTFLLLFLTFIFEKFSFKK